MARSELNDLAAFVHNLSGVPTRTQGIETDSQLTREINGRVAELGRMFVAVAGDESPMDFLCECGHCSGTVSLTVARYEAEGGAWIPGHEPQERPDGMPLPATS